MRGFYDEVVPHQMTIEAYGFQVHLCASTPELMSRIELLLPPGSRRIADKPDAHRMGIVDEEDGTYSVYQGANRAAETATLPLALVIFGDQLESVVAINAQNRIFVHAGVVGRDGHAVVIPGGSFSGKSTLVEALVRRGATYYSDEFAAIDPEGLIHPYARDLTLRHLAIKGEDGSWKHSAESLGGVVGTDPLPMDLAIVTYYVPGATWSPRRLSRGEAALALLSNAVPARYRPEEALRFLSRAVNGATVLEGQRGEADEFAEMLLEGAVA